MPFASSICKDDARRSLLGASNGIDFLEVSEDQLTLRVHFINALPPGAYGLPGAPQNIEVIGGVREKGIRVIDVRHADDRLLEVDVDRRGDFSTYTLLIHSGSIDPVFSKVDFSFKVSCPTRFDCKPKPCPPDLEPDPPIDYLAKDYASFNRALIDFLSVRAPSWNDTHPAEVGVMLRELIAYAGDYLSYYHDSVSNEAFLETALQRISVRRHARFVDYQMHDGASARVFVQFRVTAAFLLPEKTQILTRIDRRLGASSPPYPALIPDAIADEARGAAAAIFEVTKATPLEPSLHRIEIHTWQNNQCCLPKGVTEVDLTGDLTASLHTGTYLLLEEIASPVTGLAPDADRTHRQVARLTSVELTNDPLSGPVTRVRWSEADALRFPFCISARPAGSNLNVTTGIAGANLVYCDHGRTRREWYPVDPAFPLAQGARSTSRAFRFRLQEGPLSFSAPFDEGAAVATLQAAAPASAAAAVKLTVRNSAGDTPWTPLPDLLASKPFDTNFAVETDNEGVALLRFGDSEHGQAISDGSFILAEYRTGIGAQFNASQDALAHVLSDPFNPVPALVNIEFVRNPIDAWGGTDAEPVARVKQVAPTAFRLEQFRAVTEADYIAAAEKHPGVSHALARFRWTGSWLTVFLSIDPKASLSFDDELKRSVLAWMTRYALAGYDLEIQPPIYIALDLEIDVCVQSDQFRPDVEAAVIEVLGGTNRNGFFNPDKFTFGQPLFLSQLLAAIQSVEGVSSATVRRFRRFNEHDPDPGRPATAANIDRGYIKAGTLEILRLDNDPSFPENGSFTLRMLGGK